MVAGAFGFDGFYESFPDFRGRVHRFVLRIHEIRSNQSKYFNLVKLRDNIRLNEGGINWMPETRLGPVYFNFSIAIFSVSKILNTDSSLVISITSCTNGLKFESARYASPSTPSASCFCFRNRKIW